MKIIPRPAPPQLPYSLHDMHIIGIDADGDILTLHFQYGFVETTPPWRQVDGSIRFLGVDWDFCYVYRFSTTGNEGRFTGEKQFLHKFVENFHNSGFSVIDETYGFNQSKLAGYLLQSGETQECIIEIYHTGDMQYLLEEEVHAL